MKAGLVWLTMVVLAVAGGCESSRKANRPAGQDSPEKTVAKFCAAMANLDKASLRECLTGSEENIAQAMRGMDAMLAWEDFHEAVVAAWGEKAWGPLVDDLGTPHLTRENLKRVYGQVAVDLGEAHGDRATVTILYGGTGGGGTAPVLRVDGIWLLEAGNHPGLQGQKMLARSLQELPALRAKVGQAGVTPQSLRKDLETAFGLDPKIRLPLNSTAPTRSSPPSSVCVTMLSSGGERPYEVNGRRMTPAELRAILQEEMRKTPDMDVLIRAASIDTPHAIMIDLVELCRQCGLRSDQIGYEVNASSEPGPSGRP